MSTSLPESIAAYFEVSNGGDTEHLGSCFTQDAVVRDEGRTHHGLEAIQSWKSEVRRKLEYSVEPLNVLQDGDRVTVPTRVVGNFTGSPLQLDHVFLLSGGKIRSLEIG